ncbi:hypothetical protein FRC03_011326 [Tulasnella sp. 419]|nr:hypothetical protein FRC02_011408 [Tulasnella sp. 418]KAG8966803.1 hypothetical protein FRC03_011326 [Tulasnella sp. 419]
MGGLQSTLSPEQIALGGGVAVTVAIGTLFYNAGPPNPSPATQGAAETASSKKKAKKQKSKTQAPSEATHSKANEQDKTPPGSLATSLTENLPPQPGLGDAPDVAPPSKNKKKKRSKATPTASTLLGTEADNHTQSLRASTLLDSSWTRVPSRKKQGKHPVDMSLTEASSDAGATTSVTEEDAASSVPDVPQTLAEKLLPKPPKTEVDDMFESSNVPELARVMRVTAPVTETPGGISWRDYEDAADLQQTEDDDEGWGIVKSRKPKSTRTPNSETPNDSPSVSTESLTKQQRRNAAKREANKAVKAAAEEDRLARLAQHKRELEKIKIEEQYKKSQKNALSGGMNSSVQNGQLVWE